jgi:hypothetical protein
MGIGLSKPLMQDVDGFDIISRETLDYSEALHRRRRNTAIFGVASILVAGLVFIYFRRHRRAINSVEHTLFKSQSIF